MNFKTTILLILCLVIAGIAVYFVQRQKPAEQTPPAASKLIDLTSADISKITITPADDKQIVLEKQGTDWRLLEPVNARADSGAVDELVSSLTDLESHGKADLSGDNAKVTGLASPRYRVEIAEKSGKTVKLAVGKPTEVGDELYVQKEGDSQADRVASSLYAALNKPASNFRDLKLLDIKSPELNTIDIKKGAETVSLDREGNNWQINAGPTTMPADESEATDLAMGISNLRANEFVAEKPDDLKHYGLDDPQIVVNFTIQPTVMPGTTRPTSKPTQSGWVKFGRYQDLRKQNVYVQTSGSSAIALVPAMDMTKFDKKPLDLRDKNVLKIDKNEVESISIVTNKPATTQPTTRKADESTLTIVRNKEVPAQTWHAPMALPNQKDAKAQATIEPTSAPATMASTEPASQPTTVAASQPTSKPAPPKWEITSEPKGAADETAVDALLNQLSPLRVEKFIEKNPTTEPSDTYTLTITTSNGTYTIHLTDPGSSKNPIGEYNGLTFEVSRFFLEKVSAKFTPSSAGPGSGESNPGVQ